MRPFVLLVLLVAFSLFTVTYADQSLITISSSITNSAPIKITETSEILSDLLYIIYSKTKVKIFSFSQKD